ncbi:hypothetical protein [Barrientosiimonas endolithica]|uniref:hypothetical protein n=1 Tax=Barrientosiimonas endolithica TaxID=1535208 RepID=UPI0033065AA2
MDAGALLRNSLLALSRNTTVRDVIERAPVSRDVVRRFVPGRARATPSRPRPSWSGRAAWSRSTSSARTPSSRARPTPRARPTWCCCASWARPV